MSFDLVYEKRFINDLKSIPSKDKIRIKSKLEWLADNADICQHTMLKGDEFKEVFKLRIGSWRVFYKIEFPREIIYILTVMDRKEAYRKR